MNNNPGVWSHYDSISPYMYWTNKLKKIGRAELNFHRELYVPREWINANPKAMPSNFLHDLILENLSLQQNPCVLDAGCGFGGTIFWLHEKIGGRYDGITISASQKKIADSHARKKEKKSSCRFFVQNYDQPLGPIYDVIIAIESLIHSKEINHTINNLSNGLKSGGYLLFVEDVLVEECKEETKEFAYLKEYWHIAHFPTEHNYNVAISQANLSKILEKDLTPIVKLTPLSLIEGIIAVFSMLTKLPFNPIITLAKFHYAQMILHHYYLQGKIKYKLVVAQKQTN